MPTYVAFLRAINLGKRNRVPMADLRACLTVAGFEDVDTHIQTGNVRLSTRLRAAGRVEDRVEAVLGERFGFAVPTIAFTPPELRQVYDDALAAVPPRGNAAGERRYVQLFKAGQAPTGDAAEAIAAWDRPGEAGLVDGRAVHVWLDVPTQEARFYGAFARQLAAGTNRNLTVLGAVVERWAG